MLVVEHSHHLRGVHTQSELSHIKVKTLNSIHAGHISLHTPHLLHSTFIFFFSSAGCVVSASLFFF